MSDENKELLEAMALMTEGFKEMREERLKEKELYLTQNTNRDTFSKKTISIIGLVIAVLSLTGGWATGYKGSIYADAKQETQIESNRKASNSNKTAIERLEVERLKIITFNAWIDVVNGKLSIDKYNEGVIKDNYNFEIIEDHMQLPLIEKKEIRR